MATFIVTVTRTITAHIPVEASTAAEARRKIDDYGADIAAVDMATDDEVTARIVRVRKDGVAMKPGA